MKNKQNQNQEIKGVIIQERINQKGEDLHHIHLPTPPPPLIVIDIGSLQDIKSRNPENKNRQQKIEKLKRGLIQ